MRVTAAIAAIAIAISTSGCDAFAPSDSASVPSRSVTTSALFEKNAPRHDVRSSGAAAEMDPEEAKIQAAFAEHQQNAPKLGWATDIRSLVQYNHGFAVMSTNSKANPGYPGGSVVGFAPDEEGRPLFVFSGMSTHTQDILADPRCSVTIASKEFKGAADGRVNLMGEVTLLKNEEKEAAKACYLAKHPGEYNSIGIVYSTMSRCKLLRALYQMIILIKLFFMTLFCFRCLLGRIWRLQLV